jgi:membrane-bound serine protease (ClpP class)
MFALALLPRVARAQPCVLYAELDGIVNAGTASHLLHAIDAAERGRCAVVLVRLDTPGGMLDSTREIVRRFLGSRVPVIVWVAPDGARAGSAGMFITIAAHVAAMAPGSNIGAAHPVLGSGEDPEKAGGKEIARKVENDAAAFARAIAEKRQRNVKWAEAAVRESLSYTAREAKHDNVVDLIASSAGELLDMIDGRTVGAGGRELTLRTRGARLEPFPMTIQERVLDVLGNPNLAYLLLMLGMLGLMVEFYHPGTYIPAGVGLVSLLLAAIGLQMLPVNFGGVVLLAVAVALFVAELFITSHGLLAIGGTLALLLGSALLFDQSDPDFFADRSLRLSWGVVAPLVGVVAVAAVALAWRAARASRLREATGREALLGMQAVVLTPLAAGDAGQVRILGEIWRAKSADARPIAAGVEVRVVAIAGLTLTVEPNAPSSKAPTSREQTTEGPP